MHWSDLLVGALLGAALTLLVGYWFYVLQTRRNSPRIAFRSFSWPVVVRAPQHGQEPSGDIEIRYRGTAIPRLTRSRVVLWNPGWKVIEARDVVASDPLSFLFPDGDVLEATLVKTTRDAPSVSVRVDEGRCFVEFDFLDREDGATIDLLHTAADAAPSWSGTVKGMPEGIQDFGTLVPSNTRKPRKRPRTIVAESLGEGLGTGAGVLSALVVAQNLSGWKLLAFFVGVAVIVVATVGILARFRRRRRIPSALTES